MKGSTLSIIIAVFIFIVLGACRPQGPDIGVLTNDLKGYVIAKESCQLDPADDYWLVDFTYGDLNERVGDTIILDGRTYFNVLKTKELSQEHKQLGLILHIEYKSISKDRVISQGCSVSNPIIYPLKEVTINVQSEIR